MKHRAILRTMALAAALVSLPGLAADGPSPPVREGETIRLGLVRVDPRARTVRLPAKFQITQGILEYLLVADYGKTHESLLVTEASAYDLQSALLLLHARPLGTNATANAHSTAPRGPGPISVPAASRIEAHAEWTRNDQLIRRPLHELVALADTNPNLTHTGKLSAGPWMFTGSFVSAEGFSAHFEGSYIALIEDPSAILGNPRRDRFDDDIHVACPDLLPTNGSPVTLELTVARPTREP